MLEVRGLTTQYVTSRGIVHAVNDVSFDVPERHLLGLVGETGSGKSATIRSILGLLRRPGRVVAGGARLDGTDLIGQPERAMRRLRGSAIAYVGQNPFGSLNPVLRIEHQFVNMFRAHRPRSSRAAIIAAARERLLQVGMRDPDRVLSGYAHELSGGMAQRVVIAMALLLNPKVIVADEPTTALDLTVQRQLMDLLRSLIETQGCAVLLVTHDLGIVAQYADTVAVMYAGQIVEYGLVTDVLLRPAHPYTDALVASAPSRARGIVPPPARHGPALDMTNYPVGCPYRSRCPLATVGCEEKAPATTEVGRSRTVRCYHPLVSPASAHAERNHAAAGA